MSVSETAFNGNAERFADYAETVRGYVRYEITQRNLDYLVTGPPLRVADVGGGSGPDSLWLAELGHTVTLIEPADDQVELAKQRFLEASKQVQERITIRQSDPTEVAAKEPETYDLVLSHGVAMYMQKPQVFINKLAALTKPGGHISLLEKNYYGKRAHLVAAQQLDELKNLSDGTRTTNNLGRKAWSFKPHQLADHLKRAGVKPVHWFGVRIVTDSMNMPVSQLSSEELKAIIDLEYEYGHDEHLRWGSQMLHFIGQKV